MGTVIKRRLTGLLQVKIELRLCLALIGKLTDDFGNLTFYRLCRVFL